jgi:hypothetical protein
VLSKDGASVREAAVELRDPHLDGDRLTFDVRVLEGDLADARSTGLGLRRHYRPAQAETPLGETTAADVKAPFPLLVSPQLIYRR